MKQSEAAELLGVTQPTISRFERGVIEPTGRMREKLLDLVSARPGSGGDAALRRLVESSEASVHLICDLTHRLLAASRPREREWGRAAIELLGVSLWRFATEAICQSEARLAGIGWADRDGARSLRFETGPNASFEVRIVPGVLLWERLLLSDGSPARLVTSI